jgi:hypothetical protein
VKLSTIGRKPSALPPDAHVVLAVVRNEMLRLPYLLDWYRRLGFDQFIFVDNNSKDGTGEYLAGQPNSFVFFTKESFGQSGGGAGLGWKNFLLDQFCPGRWVIVADADELLVWPGSENETIRDLTGRFDAEGAECLMAMLLDMYSEKPFGRIGYTTGAPFLDFCPWFDPGPYKNIRVKRFPFREYYGGVRARLFQSLPFVAFHPPTVSKVPLLKWRQGQRFTRAQHSLKEPMKLAPMRAALLHFKMFDDLPEKCRVEPARGQYFAHGREYLALAMAIERAPNHSFFDPEISRRYRDTKQLVQARVMHPRRPYKGYGLPATAAARQPEDV